MQVITTQRLKRLRTHIWVIFIFVYTGNRTKCSLSTFCELCCGKVIFHMFIKIHPKVFILICAVNCILVSFKLVHVMFCSFTSKNEHMNCNTRKAAETQQNVTSRLIPNTV